MVQDQAARALNSQPKKPNMSTFRNEKCTLATNFSACGTRLQWSSSRTSAAISPEQVEGRSLTSLSSPLGAARERVQECGMRGVILSQSSLLASSHLKFPGFLNRRWNLSSEEIIPSVSMPSSLEPPPEGARSPPRHRRRCAGWLWGAQIAALMCHLLLRVAPRAGIKRG